MGSFCCKFFLKFQFFRCGSLIVVGTDLKKKAGGLILKGKGIKGSVR